jgi:rSAM/selenodomain-associated transferase 1
MKKEALLVFQKNPLKGKVKSRLAATVGEEVALDIYQFLVEQTFKAVRGMDQAVLVFFSDFIPEENQNPNQVMKIQQGNDLGEKMKNAFEEAFFLGFHKVVIIGTDCPDLTSDLLCQSFEQLDQTDLVIGPAGDGGYYLLGMKSTHPFLFEDIEWSTSQVFSQTLAAAKKNNLSFGQLPVLHDIDEEEDWKRFITQHPSYGNLSGYHH